MIKDQHELINYWFYPIIKMYVEFGQCDLINHILIHW